MPPSPRRVRLSVSVVDAQGRPLRGHRLATWLSRVAPLTRPTAVTVAVVSDARVRELNRSYRGANRATDVLSFPTDLESPARSRSAFLGDIVIARGVARRQAREAGHGEQTEWRVLALHGLLHLLGYDHETDTGRMARIEARLRRKGGLPLGLIERGTR
jgi:probable rRNA maturation factor